MLRRTDLLRVVDHQRADLERCADVEEFDRFRQGAIGLLTDRRIRDALDVEQAPASCKIATAATRSDGRS